VLVAPAERELRIEVGYGLEGVLPDGLAGQIIRDQFIPKFRDGDYDGGIVDGVTRVAEVVRRGERLTPEQIAAIEAAETPSFPWWIIPGFLSPFVAIGAFMLGVGFRNGGSFEKVFGSIFGGVPLLLGSIAAVIGAWWALPLLGGLTLLVFICAYTRGYRLLEGTASTRSLTSRRTSSSSSSSSSWDSSSSDSSWSSSSSSSSSSSFGGGSSGGGGASGKW
jgi:uncharacterized protein